MKNLLVTFVFLIVSNFGFGQASSSSDFQLTITFDTDIPVKSIIPFYFEKSGNYFERIVYSINKKENSITISGHNSYILYVDFPVLVFTTTEKMKLPNHKQKVLKTNMYYLVSKIITSYSGTQIRNFHFSAEKDAKIILASQTKHNEQNSHQTLKLSTLNVYNGDSFEMPITTELIGINKL